MCSFIFSNKKSEDLEKINFYTKFRGPDYTSVKKINNFLFLHNLLSITGDFTIQPFIDGDIVCIYNGEIYNHKDFGDFKTDGEVIIQMYKKFGFEFVKHIDGEFAIVLVDFNKNKAIFSSDVFKTKPIFYSCGENNLGCASYSTPLIQLGHTNVEKMKPNKALVFDLIKMDVINEINIHEFDLNQHKKDVHDWVFAFEKSIEKRAKNVREKVFIGLSGGYDSGAICCELLKQNIYFKAYSVIGSENQNVLNQRFDLLKNKAELQQLTKKPDEIRPAHQYIKDNTENFMYVTHSNSSDYNEYYLPLVEDNGARHLSHVCKHAINDGKKILISGQGADEIFSDYGFNGEKKYKHSNFGGKFPNDLNTIYPWPSFFNSSMESYLAKEEYVAGSYGIEARYPFLDLKVIQEFLWLKPEIKNSHYKSVLFYYLSNNKFPFTKDEKIGF